jgi:YHS domain-containing protein
MSAKQWLIALALVAFAPLAAAGTYINTAGSDDGTAISGFDTVAFFTAQRALKGKAEFTAGWAGAKWLFVSADNLALFKADPEKYAPQYGGHCAWCVSERCICGRPANGAFEIIEGKLYLFPAGNKGNFHGTKNAWWNTGGGPARRIPNGEKHWPELKARLEAQPDNTKGATPIPGPGGGMGALP